VFCGVGFGSGLHPKHQERLVLHLLCCLFRFGYARFYQSVFFIFSCLIGIYICGHTAKVMGVHDDGRIVWDEFAGQSITFAFNLFNLMNYNGHSSAFVISYV
jgi:phosphatidylglycerophosphatase A